jgi:hypothetical protein
MDTFLDQATTTLQYGYPHFIPKLYRQQREAQEQYYNEKQRQLRRAREARILNNMPSGTTFLEQDQYRFGNTIPPAGMSHSMSMGALPPPGSSAPGSARSAASGMLPRAMSTTAL